MKKLRGVIRQPKTRQLIKEQVYNRVIIQECREYGVMVRGLHHGHIVDGWDDLIAYGFRTRSWKKWFKRDKQYRIIGAKNQPRKSYLTTDRYMFW